MMKLNLIAAAAAALVPSTALATPAPAKAMLTVAFDGIRVSQGRVMLSIYDDESRWSNGQAVRSATAEVRGGRAEARIEDLAPGRYGIKAFHDEDGDGKIGLNPFGTPIEPFGFSRNAIGERGTPRWDSAAFDVVAGANSQTITVR